uniref:Uncharacterized protein n=1 Tax=Rhipicephalus zambeziensis TaxID=60191 RepID=A0A224YFY8_9ACAR
MWAWAPGSLAPPAEFAATGYPSGFELSPEAHWEACCTWKLQSWKACTATAALPRCNRSGTARSPHVAVPAPAVHRRVAWSAPGGRDSVHSFPSRNGQPPVTTCLPGPGLPSEACGNRPEASATCLGRLPGGRGHWAAEAPGACPAGDLLKPVSPCGQCDSRAPVAAASEPRSPDGGAGCCCRSHSFHTHSRTPDRRTSWYSSLATTLLWGTARLLFQAPRPSLECVCKERLWCVRSRRSGLLSVQRGKAAKAHRLKQRRNECVRGLRHLVLIAAAAATNP